MTFDTTASALTAGQYATLETFYGAFTRKIPIFSTRPSHQTGRIFRWHRARVRGQLD